MSLVLYLRRRCVLDNQEAQILEHCRLHPRLGLLAEKRLFMIMTNIADFTKFNELTAEKIKNISYLQ